MAADSLTPETDVRTRPNPEDESSPSTAPVAPAIATSVIMIEPPAPEALPPPPPVVEPGVPESCEAVAFVLGLGEGLTGLTATIVALTRHLTCSWIEGVLLDEISAIVLFSLPFRTPIRPSLGRRVAVVRSLRPHPSAFEWL